MNEWLTYVVLGGAQWHNRWGAGGQRLLTGKFLLTYREKKGKEKIEKGEMEKKRRKIVKGKVKNWKWEGKFQNERKELFCFSLFKTMEICFGSTKMENFLSGKKNSRRGKKNSRRGKKSGKMTLPPQKIFPVTPLVGLYTRGYVNWSVALSHAWKNHF